MPRLKMLPRTDDSRQRWSRERLKAAHAACVYYRCHVGTIDDAAYRACLEATELLANEIQPPTHAALKLSPAEQQALLTLLEEFPLTVTLTSIITKLRKLRSGK